jgi:hypothetical protein
MDFIVVIVGWVEQNSIRPVRSMTIEFAGVPMLIALFVPNPPSLIGKPGGCFHIVEHDAPRPTGAMLVPHGSTGLRFRAKRQPAAVEWPGSADLHNFSVRVTRRIAAPPDGELATVHYDQLLFGWSVDAARRAFPEGVLTLLNEGVYA